MQRLSSILTGTAVVGTTLLLVFGGLLSTASAASPINFMNPVLGNILLCSDVRLVQQDEFGNFDRETCEQSCRSRYGVGPIPYMEEQGWGGGGSYSPGYYLYASCIDGCNRQYWNDFDRKMDNLKKTQ
ncbi:MAG: hypothetical protein ACLP5H_27710 [Desulfomonilaceae bacterium]